MNPPLRLVEEDDTLAEFAHGASQAERNAVYDGLFALAEGSATARYDLTTTRGRYRLRLGRTLEVHGDIAAEHFSVSAIVRTPPEAERAA